MDETRESEDAFLVEMASLFLVEMAKAIMLEFFM